MGGDIKMIFVLKFYVFSKKYLISLGGQDRGSQVCLGVR